MKKLVLGLMVFGSLASFAETNSNIIKLQNPLHPETGLPFSGQNSQRLDGVCKSLGFETYLFNSARRSRLSEDTVVVDGDGQVISMPVFQPIVEIWCKGKAQSPAFQGIVKVKNPIHIESNLPFSTRNAQSFNGVCRYLGHSSYIASSARSTGKIEDTMVLDADGNPIIYRDEFESLAELSCIH